MLELACGPGVWTGQLLRHASDVTAVDASPEMLGSRQPASATSGCASSRPICSTGSPTAATTWSSSDFGCHTSRPNACGMSGCHRLWHRSGSLRTGIVDPREARNWPCEQLCWSTLDRCNMG
ncbi:MAG TPA: class I SAM-dependent methyltransferase [Actinomycetes bacterium]|nr:class I SAM-dependent methyltransferase [Actinomycetes bacterium]